MMKAVEAMRSFAPLGIGRDKFNEALDEIEREIAERYMLLPVDADGVPIRVCDEVAYSRSSAKITVMSIGMNSAYGLNDVGFYGSDGVFYGQGTLKDVHHVEHRTIEDVLRDLLNDHFKWDKQDGEYEVAYEEYNDKKIVQYAEEIRSLQRKKEEITKC